MNNELILLVDDEPAILSLARMYLEQDGFRVETAVDGKCALEDAGRLHPALIVLDLMLPKIDGFEVCQRLRTSGDDVAILILTARDEDIDKIVGLELGADDYLTKPFNPRELVARVKAILRRTGRTANGKDEVITFSDLQVDPSRHEAHLGEKRLDLRTQEFELLLALISQPERVFSREQLLQIAWGYDFFGQTRTVDVHIAHLRKKMAGGKANIQTVTGIGYKLTG